MNLFNPFLKSSLLLAFITSCDTVPQLSETAVPSCVKLRVPATRLTNAKALENGFVYPAELETELGLSIRKGQN